MSASPEKPERTPGAANNHANGKKAQSHRTTPRRSKAV
jgi:hypothetical protein